jgi:hypothetical protein
MPLLGTNVKIEVQKTLAAVDTVTAITNASPPVLTATGHGWANGDVIVLDVTGMVELDGQAVRVSNITANTADLEGINAITFGTFVSGTAQQVSTWDTFGLSTSISVDQQTPDEKDATTLIDTQRKIIYGLLSAVKGQINAQFEAADVALVNLRDATKATSPRAFRITFSNATKAIFNALVAMGDAFSMEQGEIATTTCSFTLQGRQIMFYAT